MINGSQFPLNDKTVKHQMIKWILLCALYRRKKQTTIDGFQFPLNHKTVKHTSNDISGHYYLRFTGENKQ